MKKWQPLFLVSAVVTLGLSGCSSKPLDEQALEDRLAARIEKVVDDKIDEKFTELELRKQEKQTVTPPQVGEVTNIEPLTDQAALDGLFTFNTQEIDMNKDGKDDKIIGYCSAQKGADGKFIFDDGQEWAVVAQIDDKIYPLFPRQYVQLGAVEYNPYIDCNVENNNFHVLITMQSGAGLYVADTYYDESAKNFKATRLYEASNINNYYNYYK